MTYLSRTAGAAAVILLGTACTPGHGSSSVNSAATSAPPVQNESVIAEKGVANPEIWPAYDYPVAQNPVREAEIAALIKRMSLAEKIGQLVQADLCCVTPEDVKNYNLGSILVGGNSGPNGNDLSPAPD